MKLFHLSDLHIGKMLNGYSLRESQKNAFLQILKYAEEEKPDAILICGDIYDKSVPAGEAYTLFDWFLTELSGHCPGTEILIIAGNHDSPERLAYGASFLARHRIHIAALPPADRTEYLKQVTLTDEWGPVHFYLVPFIRPGHVRHLFDTNGYTDAFQKLLARGDDPGAGAQCGSGAPVFCLATVRLPETCDSETAALTSGRIGMRHR